MTLPFSPKRQGLVKTHSVCVRGRVTSGYLDEPARSFTFDYPELTEAAAVDRAVADAKALFDVVGSEGKVVIDTVYISN